MLEILIVENNTLLAIDLKDLIELHGDRRVTAIASDLREALEASVLHQPGIALIDLNLDGNATGFEVAVHLGKLGIPCLFSTGYPLPFPVPEVAIGCLSKPYSFHSVSQSLTVAERIIAHQSLPEEIPRELELY